MTCSSTDKVTFITTVYVRMYPVSTGSQEDSGFLARLDLEQW